MANEVDESDTMLEGNTKLGQLMKKMSHINFIIYVYVS